MSNFNQTNIADEIKSRCNIVDVIGRAVPLKRAGANHKGICPFHNEKTPSFVVSEQKQIFTCFGCGAKGDVIEFVKRYNNVDFVGAAESLAKEYGISLDGAFKSNKDKDELYEINRQAARFWYRKLREKANPGYTYMQGRGISNDILNKFGIGYAEDSWQDLYNHLTKMGFDEKKLFELGLISKSQKTGRYYDKFRNRVIFPIMNTNGKVIGFSGRIIGDGEPKYPNSQESSIFLKKNNLYGLNLASKEVRNDDRIILVEGQMDVVSLYQSGVRNVSASLGTALTENQARLIKRYTKNVVLSYDADKAGQKAADRGIDILYGEGLVAKVMKVTDGKDPDEFVKAHGRTAFMELADNAQAYGDFKISMVASRYNLDDPQQRVQFIEECGSVLRRMKPVEADIYIKKLARDYDVSENAVRAEYNRDSDGDLRPQRARRSSSSASVGMSKTETDLLKLALIDEKYASALRQRDDQVFASQMAIAIFQAIGKCDSGTRPLDENRIIEVLDQDMVAGFEKVVAQMVPEGSEDRMFRDCLKSIKRAKLEEEEKLLIDSLDLADEEENHEEIVKLTQRLMELQREIEMIKRG
ncbi:MAG: DNA primase [Eubacterium sp.]|nr:DNA primase [Candidatus Colimonas fimequi]